MTQGLFESQIDSRNDGALRDAFNDIFHRFLGRDNACFRVVEVIDATIYRCGLSGSGGTRHYQNAARRIQGIYPKALQHAGLHAQVFDSEQLVLAVQKTHNDLFAVDRDIKGYPHVHLATFMVEDHPSALMTPLFGDIGPAEYLDATGNGQYQSYREIPVVDQYAIHTESNSQPVAHGFDMDIAYILLFDSRQNQVLHNGYYGRFPLGSRVLPGNTGGLVLLQSGLDGLLAGDCRNDIALEEPAGLVQIAVVQRIGKSDEYCVAILADGDKIMHPARLERYPDQQVSIDLDKLRVHLRKPKLHGQYLDHLTFINEIMRHKHFTEFAFGRFS